MNPSSVIQNGHKTRLASKLEDVVFPLTHLCEIEPVSSRTLLEQFKKAHCFFVFVCLFVFRGMGSKEVDHAFTFACVVAQTIK